MTLGCRRLRVLVVLLLLGSCAGSKSGLESVVQIVATEGT